jgi:acyl dehydratase
LAVDESKKGKTWPAKTYEVGREKIREFADALGDPNPAYRDVEAARALGHPDVIAPPTFPIVVTMRAGHQVVMDPDLGVDYSRVVHGEQKFVQTRPVRAGDRLEVVVTVENIRSAAGNDMITTRSDVRTTDGEPVGSAYSTIVVRGSGA